MCGSIRTTIYMLLSFVAFVGVMALLSYLTTAVTLDAMVFPGVWAVRVRDAHGAALAGAELDVVEWRTGERYPPIGNWRGPGSLTTDGSGRAVFRLEEGVGFGIDEWRLFWLWPIRRSYEPVLRLSAPGHDPTRIELTADTAATEVIEVTLTASRRDEPGGRVR